MLAGYAIKIKHKMTISEKLSAYNYLRFHQVQGYLGITKNALVGWYLPGTKQFPEFKRFRQGLVSPFVKTEEKSCKNDCEF